MTPSDLLKMDTTKDTKQTTHQNGKGDAPRNNQSQEFRDNYDAIDWRKKDK